MGVRRRARELALQLLAANGEDGHTAYLFELACRHEEMHFEAFAYMRQTLA